MNERREQSDRRRLLPREGGRRAEDETIAPTTPLLIAALRTWAEAARRQNCIKTSNLAIIAAARLEEFEAQRLIRSLRATAGALAREAKLGPERRREIAQQGHRTRHEKSSQQAST